MFSNFKDKDLAGEWQGQARLLRVDRDTDDERTFTLVKPNSDGKKNVWDKKRFIKWYYDKCKFTFFSLLWSQLLFDMY